MNGVTTTKVNIIGAGSHALIIADIFYNLPDYSAVTFIEKDDCLRERQKQVAHDLILPIVGDNGFFQDYQKEKHGCLILGIGAKMMSARKRIIERFDEDFFTIAIHPRAIIAVSAKIGIGTVIMAGAILNAFARTGNHVVINTGATVDHECEIGDNSFIQPGAHLAGNVKVGRHSIVGIGASVKEGITIGSNSIIGGGAFVNKDVPDNAIYVGVPAKKIRDNY